jgi:hypothetical protein
MTDISAQGHDAAGLAVVPEDDAVYVVSYCDGSKIWKYSLTDSSFLGTIRLKTTIANLQGIAYKNGYFYLVSDATGGIYVADKNGETRLLLTVDFTGNKEGLDYSQSELRLLADHGVREYIYYFTPRGTDAGFLVSNTGNIGIGTSSPYLPFSVVGDTINTNSGTVRHIVESTSGGQAQLDLKSASNLMQFFFRNSDGDFGIFRPSQNLTLFRLDGDGHIELNSFNNQDIELSGGRVGINNTAPPSRLTVKGVSTSGGQAFEVQSSASTTILMALDSGNVGIGTSSPSALFAIQGDTLVAGNLTSAGLTATGTLTLLGGQTDYRTSSTSTLPTAQNAFSFATSLTAAPLLSLDTTNSRVGINTAFPRGSLSIHGTAPTIYIDETDQTDPAGTYTIQGNNDNLSFFRGTLGASASEIKQLRNGNFYFAGYELRTKVGGSFVSGTSLARFSTTEHSYINNGLNFGLASTTPAELLSVHGNALIAGTTTVNSLIATSSLILKNPGALSSTESPLCINALGEVLKGASGGTCTPSARGFKENIQPFTHGLDWVLKFKPAEYTWKADGSPGISLIADDLAEIHPSLATYKDGKVHSINDRTVQAATSNSIRELNEKLEAQQKEIEGLKELIHNKDLSTNQPSLWESIKVYLFSY